MAEKFIIFVKRLVNSSLLPHFSFASISYKGLGIFFLPIFVFLLAYFMGDILKNNQPSVNIVLKRLDVSECSPADKLCVVDVGKHQLSVQFLQTPSALTPFEVRLQTDIKNVEHIVLRFYMENMDMGYNTFELLKKDNETWQEYVILPICSLNSKLWRMELQLIATDLIQTADFGFEQVK